MKDINYLYPIHNVTSQSVLLINFSYLLAWFNRVICRYLTIPIHYLSFITY
jgi:hypothetical protein